VTLAWQHHGGVVTGLPSSVVWCAVHLFRKHHFREPKITKVNAEKEMKSYSNNFKCFDFISSLLKAQNFAFGFARS